MLKALLGDHSFLFLRKWGYMKTEYEVRILDIDVEDIKKRLEEIKATWEWDLLQRRYVYDFNPKQNGKWIRLRTNGKDTTLTIKDVVSSKIDGTRELEVGVDDFEKTNLILKELGYTPKGYQENRRCQYKYKGIEIDIDYWPRIPTYLEIEGSSEEEVMDIVKLLGFNEDDVTAKDVESIYLDYGINLEEINELKLEEERK